LSIVRESIPFIAVPLILSVVSAVLGLWYLFIPLIVVALFMAYFFRDPKRDVPVVQAVGLIFAAVYISLNIIADIAAIVANPRLRHPK